MNNHTCEIFDEYTTLLYIIMYYYYYYYKKDIWKFGKKKKEENNDRRTVISNFKVFIASMEYIVLYLYCYTISNVIRA